MTNELLNVAIAVAEEAGQHVLEGLERGGMAVDTKSTATDMVSMGLLLGLATLLVN